MTELKSDLLILSTCTRKDTVYILGLLDYLFKPATLGPECKAKKLSKWHNSPERNSIIHNEKF